jgi:hypothetical protein
MAWSSIPSASFQPARLHEIVACARYNNKRHHISGMLLFTGAHFLGLLEGAEWDLARLWHNLTRDERHRDLLRIGDELCGVRWSPVWMMAYLDNSVVSVQIETLRMPEHGIAPGWAQTIRHIMLSADAM